MSFCVSSINGLGKFVSCGMNLLRYCASPNKPFTPVFSAGSGVSLIARRLPESTRSPLSVDKYHIKGISSVEELAFICQAGHLALYSAPGTLLSPFASTKVLPHPTTMKSSDTTSISDRPSISSCMLR